MYKQIFLIKKMEYRNNRKENHMFINNPANFRSVRKNSNALEDISQETLDMRFEESQIVLERISRCEKLIFKKTNESDLLFCMHCKVFIDVLKKNICHHCSMIFCEKHKLELRHNCPNIPKDEKMETYQNAKNIFQMRLKQIKMKAGS